MMMVAGSPDAKPPYRPTPPPPGEIPDAETAPELYSGLLLKRVLAYLIDVVILLLIAGLGYVIIAIAGVLTFGVLWPLAPVFGAALPICYHGLTVGGEAGATIGMRIMGLHVCTLFGWRPTMLQAFVMAVLFYASISLLTPLVLLVTFFNRRRRALHDFLSGVVVINRLP